MRLKLRNYISFLRTARLKCINAVFSILTFFFSSLEVIAKHIIHNELTQLATTEETFKFVDDPSLKGGNI